MAPSPTHTCMCMCLHKTLAQGNLLTGDSAPLSDEEITMSIFLINLQVSIDNDKLDLISITSWLPINTGSKLNKIACLLMHFMSGGSFSLLQKKTYCIYL